jgi:hypothetical protein
VTRLVIDERARSDGAPSRTWLELAGGKLVLGFDETKMAVVEERALAAVMKRYGKALAADIVVSGPTLELEGGSKLSLLRHRARYDVVARDFLVYQAPGSEPVAELATSVSAALAHLARAPRGD